MATATFPLYDALLHGQLESLLRKWREEGKSTREIAALVSERIPTEEGISHMTIQRWCRQKKIPKAVAA